MSRLFYIISAFACAAWFCSSAFAAGFAATGVGQKLSDSAHALPAAAKNDSEGGAKRKYVVDTSEGFIGGYYVGTPVGSDSPQTGATAAEDAEAGLTVSAQKDAKDDLFTAQSALFSIVADDHDALSVSLKFARACERVFAEYFPSYAASARASRLAVNLSVYAKNPNMSKFSKSAAGNGSVSAAVRWDNTLEMDSFCDFLSNCILSLAARAQAADAQPAYWLMLAISQEIECSMTESGSAEQARLCAFTAPDGVSEVFAYAPAPSEAGGMPAEARRKYRKAASFWTLKTLVAGARSKKTAETFLKAALVLHDAQKTCAAYADAKKSVSAEGLDGWFRCAFTGEVWARLGGIYNTDMSRAEILRLAYLPVGDARKNRRFVCGSELFDSRGEFFGEMQTRLIEIKVALLKINPVYHNSLILLGETFEAALADDSDAFSEKWAEFSAEFASAQALSSDIASVMNMPLSAFKKPRKANAEKP